MEYDVNQNPKSLKGIRFDKNNGDFNFYINNRGKTIPKLITKGKNKKNTSIRWSLLEYK